MACSTAQRASSARRRRPVFSRMRVRWFWTVRGEMYSCLPISLSVRPSRRGGGTPTPRPAAGGGPEDPPPRGARGGTRGARAAGAAGDLAQEVPGELGGDDRPAAVGRDDGLAQLLAGGAL